MNEFLKDIRFVINLTLIVWWLIPILWIMFFIFEGVEDANGIAEHIFYKLIISNYE